MRYQPIYDIAEICVRKGITEVILCPGSRCAPLTLAFTRHPGITARTFSDERSAGFVALGIAQSMRKPVVIVCTSGTAVYNLAPAIAEAYFSHTPLLILTADRPAEWIAQHDGQTIYQQEVFGKHVKKYFGLPQDYEHPDSVWAINRIVNDALNIVAQQNTLIVTGSTAEKEEKKDKSYLHRGIATRSFERKFSLADHVKVVDAKLADGLLTLALKREIPEASKPRSIPINGATLIEGRSPKKAA